MFQLWYVLSLTFLTPTLNTQTCAEKFVGKLFTCTGELVPELTAMCHLMGPHPFFYSNEIVRSTCTKDVYKA